MRCPVAQCQRSLHCQEFLSAILAREVFGTFGFGLAEPSWFGSPARVIRGSIDY
jgi:hypothetical protein